MVTLNPAEEEAEEYLHSKLEEAELWNPRLGVILGSGLGGSSPQIENILEFNFNEIPGLPPCKVPGQEGVLGFGGYGVIAVMLQLGRLHYYQGLDMA